jgi:hypothetical protein
MIMADLPSRPAPDATKHQIVDATDRVKSVSDKTDPRFEAALNKVDREAARRAKAEAADAKAKTNKAKQPRNALNTPADDAAETETETEAEAEARKDRPVRPSSTSFSFNQMDDEDQADTEDVQ